LVSQVLSSKALWLRFSIGPAGFGLVLIEYSWPVDTAATLVRCNCIMFLSKLASRRTCKKSVT